MKRITATSTKVTIRAVLLGVSLFSAAWGQNNCKQAKGDTVQVAVGPAPSSGAVTNGGDLNGTLTDVFVFANPSPILFSFAGGAMVVFAGDVTITTNQGRLKASAVHIVDQSNGVGSVQARINPATSTGRFAGASGFLFLNGVTTNTNPLSFTIQLEITGQICYAGN